MDKRLFGTRVFVMLSAVILMASGTAGAQAPAEKVGTGLKPPTPDQIREMNKHKIKSVRPNALALERKNKERKARGLSPIDGKHAARRENEVEMDTSIKTATVSATSLTANSQTVATVNALPAGVDNSLLPAFPPIGNQGGQGSCAAFAYSYYMASHETCLVRGCDNKAVAPPTLFSPKWTYNMINGGVDGGSWFTDHHNVFVKNGGVSWSQFPYVSTDFKQWDLNPEHWVSGINFRVNAPLVTMTSISSESGLANLKQYLANGHVVNFATDVYGWMYSTVKADPAGPNPFAGQQIMVMNAPNAGSGHAMTIVGYDDTIWADLNGNGVVDSGEKGALKIANSWGAWRNAGFVWVAYDALKKVSAVAGGPASTYRTTAFWYDSVYAMTVRPSYTPRLIARFTVNHLRRSEMSVQIGASDLGGSSPTTQSVTAALNYQGGPYAFDGTTNGVDGSFALDLSDLAPTDPSNANYYLRVYDRATSNPVTLKAFSVYEPATGKTFNTTTSLPLSADASNTFAVVPYSVSGGNIRPVAVIKATQTTSATGTTVSFDGTGSHDSDGSVVSYSWNFGDGSTTATGSLVSQTYPLAGNYIATLTVMDDKGATGSATYTVSVSDTIAPTAPAKLGYAVIQSPHKRKAPVLRLTWSASTDNLGVTAYEVYRNDALVAKVTTTSYAEPFNTGTWTYYVKARDAAGNRSAASNSVTARR